MSVTIAVCALAMGCATSVEYADPPEEVVLLADGSPYRGEMDRVAVSRDGRFVAFPAQGGAFGLGEEFRGIVVYDREHDAVHGTCEPGWRLAQDDWRWELSEDGGYVMILNRRCDLITGEVTDVDSTPLSSIYTYGYPSFFKDGSGAAFYDRGADSVRVVYYDGRPDVVVPLDFMPSEGVFSFVASDRWGRHLLVSGRYVYPPYHPEVGTTHWMISVADGSARRLDVGESDLQVVNFHREGRPGWFNDDGSVLEVVLRGADDSRHHGFDTETLEERPSNGWRRESVPFDDGRFIITAGRDGSMSSFFVYGETGLLGVADEDGNVVRLRADLSAYLDPEGVSARAATLVVAAPASQEVFLSIPLHDGGHALVVVSVPPPEAP